MVQVQDMMGRTVFIKEQCKKIVSLVPSQTELLYDLGLEAHIVGITKFCVHPARALKEKMIVGGTKKVRFDLIKQLNPDIIIANKEENAQNDIEYLEKQYPVWISDIQTFEQNEQMIQLIAQLFHKENEAKTLIEHIHSAWQNIPQISKPLKVAYCIWKEPWMFVARHTFIHDMLCKLGFANCFSDDERYPMVSLEHLQSLQPDIIMLSTEPYPFQVKHKQQLQPYFPKSKIIIVDGEMFSWYGSRMLAAASYMQQLLVQIQKEF